MYYFEWNRTLLANNKFVTQIDWGISVGFQAVIHMIYYRPSESPKFEAGSCQLARIL